MLGDCSLFCSSAALPSTGAVALGGETVVGPLPGFACAKAALDNNEAAIAPQIISTALDHACKQGCKGIHGARASPSQRKGRLIGSRSVLMSTIGLNLREMA